MVTGPVPRKENQFGWVRISHALRERAPEGVAYFEQFMQDYGQVVGLYLDATLCEANQSSITLENRSRLIAKFVEPRSHHSFAFQRPGANYHRPTGKWRSTDPEFHVLIEQPRWQDVLSAAAALVTTGQDGHARAVDYLTNQAGFPEEIGVQVFPEAGVAFTRSFKLSYPCTLDEVFVVMMFWGVFWWCKDHDGHGQLRLYRKSQGHAGLFAQHKLNAFRKMIEEKRP